MARSFQECQTLARRSGSNFYYTFLTLPRDLFRDTCVLYAYMRLTDDLGDAAGFTIEQRRESLKHWREQLHSAFQGVTSQGVFPALVDVARRKQIPCQALAEVICGVETDLDPQAFPTFAELERYCYQVAGVVGECCIRIWGFDGEEALKHARACGTAFQLTNILRDLAEDSTLGRCYLPLDDLQRFQYDETQLRAQVRNAAFVELMRFQAGRAWSYYNEAARLPPHLTPPGQRILAAMLETYGGLLREIERRDYDVFRSRVSLPSWKKWLIVGRSLLPIAYRKTPAPLPFSPESRGEGTISG